MNSAAGERAVERGGAARREAVPELVLRHPRLNAEVGDQDGRLGRLGERVLPDLTGEQMRKPMPSTTNTTALTAANWVRSPSLRRRSSGPCACRSILDRRVRACLNPPLFE
jgi:hypothetical protein